jgi:hypothetical protein
LNVRRYSMRSLKNFFHLFEGLQHIPGDAAFRTPEWL